MNNQEEYLKKKMCIAHIIKQTRPWSFRSLWTLKPSRVASQMRLHLASFQPVYLTVDCSALLRSAGGSQSGLAEPQIFCFWGILFDKGNAWKKGHHLDTPREEEANLWRNLESSCLFKYRLPSHACDSLHTGPGTQSTKESVRKWCDPDDCFESSWIWTWWKCQTTSLPAGDVP